MHWWDRTALAVATVGPVGRSPFAPGTLGSLVALPLCWGVSRVAQPWALIVVVGIVVAAMAVAHRAEQVCGRKDPGCIVIDEVAGMAVTLTGVAFTLPTAAIGFALFRVFDIFKPFPIRQLEKRINGGAGIVADDVAAGVMAHLVLRILGFWGFNGA